MNIDGITEIITKNIQRVQAVYHSRVCREHEKEGGTAMRRDIRSLEKGAIREGLYD